MLLQYFESLFFSEILLRASSLFSQIFLKDSLLVELSVSVLDDVIVFLLSQTVFIFNHLLAVLLIVHACLSFSVLLAGLPVPGALVAVPAALLHIFSADHLGLLLLRLALPLLAAAQLV